MNNKLCIIYNIAPHYRKGIFTLIDKEYDCTWYFGDSATDIRPLDLSVLHNAHVVRNVPVISTYYWQKGVLPLLSKKEYETFFMLGDTHCLSTWAILLLRKFFYHKKKIYFWTHGWYGKENKGIRLLKKVFYKNADGIFLYGNHAKRLMIENGFDESKLFVLHNSLDYNRQLSLRNSSKATDIYSSHFKNKNRNIVFIGRLTSIKRLDLLFTAIADLKNSGEHYNITLIGDGTDKAILQQQAKQLNIESNVWFYGACYDEAINAELVYNADLCVAPGNVGLTAIHAMTFGTPVATHNSFEWQMPEFEAIQQGQTGTFFLRNNASSIAEAISQWFKEHKDRDAVRNICYNEIDTKWTPEFQVGVIKAHLRF